MTLAPTKHVCHTCQVSWNDPAGESPCWVCGQLRPLHTGPWFSRFVGNSSCPATATAEEMAAISAAWGYAAMYGGIHGEGAVGRSEPRSTPEGTEGADLAVGAI